MGSIEAAARPVPRRSDAGKIRYTERDVTGLLLLAGHHGRGRPLIKKGEMTSGTTIAALLYVLSESTD